MPEYRVITTPIVGDGSGLIGWCYYCDNWCISVWAETVSYEDVEGLIVFLTELLTGVREEHVATCSPDFTDLRSIDRWLDA